MASGWPIESVLAAGPGRHELIEDLPWEEYCQLPAMNPSTIAAGLKSPKHLKHAWESQDKDSPSKIFGRALHTVCLERQELAMRYAVYRAGGARRGKDYEKFRDEAEAAGRYVLLANEFEDVVACGKSLALDDAVQEYIREGVAEATVLAVEDGIQCRGRIDWIATKREVIVDLKTTRDISERAFGRDFYAYKYDLKLGLYQRWLGAVTGKHWPVVVIAVENHAPWDVAVVPIADAVLERGAQKGLDALRELRDSIDNAEFLGVARGEEYQLYTPPWEMDDELTGAELAGAEEAQ